MKKLIFILLAIFAMTANAQTITKTKTLKTTDFGNQKLVCAIENNDTLFAIVFKTANRFKKNFTCALGNKDEALRLLQFLNDMEIEKGDVVSLDNATDNTVTKNPLGGLLVQSDGGIFSQQLRKPHIKTFIATIKSFCGMATTEDDEE